MMAIEFKQLKSSDMFIMFKIINKIGLNEIKNQLEPKTIEKLVDGFKGKGKGKDNESLMYSVGLSVSIEMVNVIIGNLPKCEDEIYTLLSRVSGKSKKEISELDMVTFTEYIVEFIKKDEFKDFTKVALKLFN